MGDSSDRRAKAVERLQAKRDFYRAAGGYVVLNVVLVIIWAVSSSGGSFWPIWTIAFGAVALAVHGWRVFGQRDITETDIQREMHKNQGSTF